MPHPYSRDDMLIGQSVAAELATGPLVSAQYSDPSRAARINEVARRLGVAPPVVEADLENMQARDRLQRATIRAQSNPIFASMMSNVRFAAAAIDDDGIHPLATAVQEMRNAPEGPNSFAARRRNLGLLGASLMVPGDVLRAAGSAAGVGFAGLAQATAEGMGGVLPPEQARAAIGWATGANLPSPFAPIAEGARDVGRHYRGALRESQTDFGNWWINQAFRGFESVPLQVAALVTAARGNPQASIAILSSLSGGQAYGEGREAGLSQAQALSYGATQGGLEAAGEAIPIFRFVQDALAGSGFFRTLAGQLVAENVGEQFTGQFQDLNTWATIEANRGKTFQDFWNERPQAALEILVATTAAVGMQTSAAQGFTRLAEQASEREQDRRAGRTIERVMSAAAQSSTRTANPGDFEDVLAQQLDGVAGENLYVPAEAVRSLFQSGEDISDDAFWGAYAEQVSEAEALGGDVVISLSAAATHLAGTPQWESIKEQVRGSPGGSSRAEVAEWDAAFSDAAQKTGEEFAALMEADRANMEPVQKVHEAMRDKLLIAGFTPDAATHLATQFAQRQRVRAERLGQPLTGQEADTVEVRQVLPEALGRVVKADDLDLVIAAMKGARTGAAGPSLADFIVKRGGIEDRGGDLASMGAGPIKGKRKKGQRGLIKKAPPAGQGSMLAETGNANTPDALALAAWEAGYFPGMAERPSVNDLLEALGKELRGRPVYSETTPAVTDEYRMAAQDLQQLLDQQGLDAGTATPQEIKAAVERYQSEVSGSGRSLEQSFMDGPRGRISFTADGKSIIDLFEARDLSTFIHETGHLYLEELRADAALATSMDTDQARQLFADWEAVKAWFKREGHPISDDGVIPTEAHELFARGFERFAMEGKAPSSVLKRAFEAFRSWLLTIYKVTDNLRAPITPEIRDVMTRLMATDDEIAAALEEQNIKALFNTAEEAGMTEAEFAAYRTTTEEARGEAYDALLYRTMATIRASRTKEYKDAEARVRSEIMVQVDEQPVFRALRLLRNGRIGEEEARKVKLDRQFLIDSYGADALDLMPRTVPPIYGDKSTVHPDAIAEEAGFSSGDEMIRTLMGHELARKNLKERGDKRSPRQAQIDEMTGAAMAERYGDPLRDGSIEEEARALIHNDRQGEVIASELRSLARRAGRRPTPYAIARKWAKDKVTAGEVRDVASGAAIQQYQRAARRAGKAAEEAMLKQDIDETFRQKQIQMLNNALISEAKKAKDRIDIAVRRLGKLARRKTMASVDQAYLEQIHGLLEQVEFRPRSRASVDRQQGFEAWAAEQRKAGHDVVVPDSFAASLGLTHWTKLTVEQLTGLDDTVQQILHLGRFKQTLLDGQERRSFEEGRDELVASAGGSGKQRKRSAANDPMRQLPEVVKSRIRWADAAMIKVEQMVDWLDGGNSSGPWNRFLFKPIADAQGRQGDLMRAYIEKINGLIQAMPKKQARDWDRWVETPELIDRVSPDPDRHGQSFKFKKDQVVMLALNMGNDGNRQRLTDGYKWSEAQVRSALDRLMTAEDWQFVQGVWDTVDELWPDIAALERRVNGVEPDKVEATPIETPYGTFRGGYFPAVYDTSYSTAAELQDAEQRIGGGAFFKATTRASSTKERAARVERPILLNMSVITRHLGEVIHDITHREAIIQASKILANQTIRNSIDRALGPEYIRAMEGWLDDIAKPGIADSRTFPLINAIGKHLHKGVSLVGLGYRVSTALIQPLGLSNLTGQIGERAVLEGIATFTAHPFRSYREVTARSAEMRDRFSTMDASIMEMYRDRAKNGLQRIGPGAFEKHAFDGILYADLLITTGGWIGAFNKGLREGMTEEEATYYADKAIRTSQGSGAGKDKSAILRANAFIRTFYPFFSYLNALYNQQRDIGRRARNIGSIKDAAEVARRLWWVAIVPPMIEALVRGGSGADDDDEESWAVWLARAVTLGNIGSIPLAGPIASAYGKGWGYRASSLQRVGEGFVRGIDDAVTAAGHQLGYMEDENVSRSWIKNVFDTIGVVTAKPLSAPGTAVQFAVDVSEGEQRPETVGDWYEGLTTGRLSED